MESEQIARHISVVTVHTILGNLVRVHRSLTDREVIKIILLLKLYVFVLFVAPFFCPSLIPSLTRSDFDS